MPGKASQTKVSRRQHLKATTAAMVTGLGLAGCLGGGDGEDSPGGTAGNGGQDLTEVSFATVPVGIIAALPMDYMTQNGIFEEEFEKEGYAIKTETTFEDTNLWVAGQIDMTGVSPLEVVRAIGPEQDMDITIFGKKADQPHGMYLKKDGPYDPDTAESKQAVVDTIIEEQANVAIRSWGAGNIPAMQNIFDTIYGYEFSPEGDFNVITADRGAAPKLLTNDEIALGVMTVSDMGATDRRDQLKPLFHTLNVYRDRGWGRLAIKMHCTRTSFYEEHPGACRALNRAWDRALAWLHEDQEEIINSEHAQDVVGSNNADDMRWQFDGWLGQGSYMRYPAMYENTQLTDDIVQDYKGPIELEVEQGDVASDWDKWLNFATYEDLGMEY